MEEGERFTLFWDGPFSQWHASYFEVDGVEYNCAEQFMMAEKARLFGDDDTLERIMEAESPRTQKRLGRVVDGFDVSVWEEEEDDGMPRCWNIVWRGNMAKFTQNDHLRDALFETAGTTLVEASPEDRIWGIGLAEDDPRALDRASWQGLNWLGEVLTDVRDQLMAR
ncbi:MAG: NADAR family protein [Deltaproteobacteria bacterium]